MTRPACTILNVSALALLLLQAGCSTLPQQPASRSWDRPQETAVGRRVADRLASRPGESGFHIIEYGREALLARAALADAAERTIDCQYYIYDPDRSGAFLTARLLAAADRGVRVRMLLDDYNLGSDRAAALLDAHPNVEVRLFNPVQIRARWMRLPQYLLDFRRLVRRMHNKIFAVDGSVALLGGRNIGDNYFDLNDGSNFRDFDLLCAGPVAGQVGSAFDEYWNSSHAVPVAQLLRPCDTNDLAELRRQLDVFLLSHDDYPGAYQQLAPGWLDCKLPDLCTAPCELIWESPNKIKGATPETARTVTKLAGELARATNEVVMESGYFVPRAQGTLHLARMVSNGVRVAIITSSLSSTDEPLIFSGYRRYRPELVRAGIDLYEYRRNAAALASQQAWRLADSKDCSLHSKVLTIDGERTWVGSFNLDPRSATLNTEIAVLVHSRELAARMRGHLDESRDPARSYRVTLDPADGRSLLWTGLHEGKPKHWHTDPESSRSQRIRARVYGGIPGLEWQL